MKLYNESGIVCRFLLILICFLLLQSARSQSTFTLQVAGNCDMCTANIEEAAYNTIGVLSGSYAQSQQLLTVQVDDILFDKNILGRNIARAGYDNMISGAESTKYNSLPQCCQYRAFDDYDETLYNIENIDFPPRVSTELSPILKGKISGQIDVDTVEPLIGAAISYEGRSQGASTNMDGNFEIGRIPNAHSIVISYVGFKTDTVDISNINTVDHILMNGELMDEVVISYRSGTTSISHIEPIQTHLVTEEELCKAACCSLSESFETSPSIDVSFTDALTGTRQIQMLGLAGKYVQISRELIPDVRSLGVVQGLKLTPGPWISGIQMSKGVGSVVNGFESMTGLINLELRKPEKSERLFLNLYGSQGGRYEGNLFVRQEFNKNLSTAILLHGNDRQRRIDNNADGFLDNPLTRGFIGINRWKYQHQNGMQAQLGVKYSHLSSVAGEIDFVPKLSSNQKTIWGVQTQQQKLELWTKIGKVFSEEKNNSIGLQLGYLMHDSENIYGSKDYENRHQSLFANLIYQTQLWNSQHSIKGGMSYLQDHIFERLGQTSSVLEGPVTDISEFNRNEMVPGTFVEYTYMPDETLTVVGGIRVDHHNQYGIIVSPRLHTRYALNDNIVIRGVVGRGWRTANPLAENPGIYANNRPIDIVNNDNDTPYGLQREQSWNMGANMTQTLPFSRLATLSIDYYYTLFDNQIIADFESNLSGEIVIRDQRDQSYGHSAQAQFDIEMFNDFDVRVAYRYNRNVGYYGTELLVVPFNPFHKAFINLAYETKTQWHFDLTLNWRGSQRIPDTRWLGEELKLDEFTPSYFIANAQIRKFLTDDFEIYLGVENMMNYTQSDPIIASDNPFDRNFDASYVWAPIFGRNLYFGIRYKLPY